MRAKSSFGLTGKAALDRVNQMQAAKSKKSNNVFRFSLSKKQPESTVIILDDIKSIDEFPQFAAQEYEIWDDANTTMHYEQVGDEDVLEGKLHGSYGAIKSYFAAFLTVLDLNHVKKDGTVVPTRKLIAIKQGQISGFAETFAQVIASYGTLRGATFTLKRDPNNKMSPKIGEIKNNGVDPSIKMIAEKDLVKLYKHDAVEKDGKIIAEANARITTYDYKKIFPKPDPAEQMMRHGISAPIGSKYETESSSAEGNWDDETDVPF